MGLSKPVITTEADISGITSTLAEIKTAVQENSGGTDAPVIGMQTGYNDSNTNTSSFFKLLTGTGKGKLNFGCSKGSGIIAKMGVKILIDGDVVLNKPSGTSSPEGVSSLQSLGGSVYGLEYVPFSESFEVWVQNTDNVTAAFRAQALFQ